MTSELASYVRAGIAVLPEHIREEIADAITVDGFRININSVHNCVLGIGYVSWQRGMRKLGQFAYSNEGEEWSRVHGFSAGNNDYDMYGTIAESERRGVELEYVARVLARMWTYYFTRLANG
jgi:hypothetical protein